MEKKVKKHIKGFHKYIVKRLKLIPNSYTQNDFLFLRKGKDLQVLWNPRAQMLNFDLPWEDREISYQTYITLLNGLKRLWNDIDFDFFSLTGIRPSENVVVRFYGLKVRNPPDGVKVPFIIYLEGDEVWDWDSVEGWPKIAKPFMRNKVFCRASWGADIPKNQRPKRSQVSSHQVQKELRRKKKQLQRQAQKNIIPDRYKENL